MPFVASVQMDSSEVDIIPLSDSEEEFSDSNTNIGYYEPPFFPSDIDSKDLSEDSNDTTNEGNFYGLLRLASVLPGIPRC